MLLPLPKRRATELRRAATDLVLLHSGVIYPSERDRAVFAALARLHAENVISLLHCSGVACDRP